MDLDLTDDQRLFHETTRRFLDGEMPLTAVRALERDPAGFDRGWWRQAAEFGWTSMLVPDEYGGGTVSGAGLRDLAIVAEEMGRLVSPGPFLATNVVATALARAGSPEQRASVLPGVVSGDVIATWAYQERGARWQPDRMALRARAAGDGFVLDGLKSTVEAAAQADQILVTARTDAGPTQFLLAADTPGITITPLDGLDFVRRFADVRFDDTAAPASAVVGRVGAAAADVEHQLQVALVLLCAEMAGAANRVFEFTLEWAFDRFSFGPPLASYQALKHRFADQKLWVESCFATTDGAARAVHLDDDRAARLASVAKAYVSDRAPEVIQDSVQLHGGIGVTWEHDLHLYLRRVTVDRTLFGTPDDHYARVAAMSGMDDERQR